MSTERGNVSRKRPQKYKNRTVFKNDLHDKTPQQKKLNSLHVSEVCNRCKDIIEWKIKYKKYKPLSQAKTCTRCQQRNILKAYHVICRGCALAALVCAKCLQSTGQLAFEAAQLSPVELLKLEAEMKRLTKTLPERKRRAFMRFMKRGKELSLVEREQSGTDKEEEEDEAQETVQKVPHTREELLEKLEQLKLSTNDEDDDDYTDNEDEEDFSGEDDCKYSAEARK